VNLVGLFNFPIMARRVKITMWPSQVCAELDLSSKLACNLRRDVAAWATGERKRIDVLAPHVSDCAVTLSLNDKEVGKDSLIPDVEGVEIHAQIDESDLHVIHLPLSGRRLLIALEEGLPAAHLLERIAIRMSSTPNGGTFELHTSQVKIFFSTSQEIEYMEPIPVKERQLLTACVQANTNQEIMAAWPQMQDHERVLALIQKMGQRRLPGTPGGTWDTSGEFTVLIRCMSRLLGENPHAS